MALAIVFALAHIPFLATSLEDIDSVNFALGVRYFDVATHRPHPPGYPVYIAAGKVAVGALDLISDAAESAIDARALAMLSLIAGVCALFFLYRSFDALTRSTNRPPTLADATSSSGETTPSEGVEPTALAATAITISCPLFWYLAVRPMSDLPGFAVAIAAQACLLTAWWRQTPIEPAAGSGGELAQDRPNHRDRRLPPPVMAASGRMIVIGALLSAISIGVRSQTVWFTVPLLLLVLLDRIGRGVAGAILGSAFSFTVGALAWAVPLVIASGGLSAYLVALGSQAGEDFAAGDMLYLNPTPRNAAFALVRTFVHPWDSTALAMVVLVLSAVGFVQVAWRERRAMAAILAMTVPYLFFHLVFQDTAFVRYALPIVPPVAFLAARGVALASEVAAPVAAAVISVWSVAVASPVLVAYAAEPSPTIRVIGAMQQSTASRPGALALHQTFRRPLEAEEVGIGPQLASPPRLEWLEWVKYWKQNPGASLWLVADPMRSDLALLDPQSRRDMTDIRWPLVARPAFGGMRPSAVQWYRLAPPGWFAGEGWSLTPETAGMAAAMGKGPSIAPITAWIRRRPESARLLIGGRNLAAAGQGSARFRVAIDGAALQEWDAPPGFFLHVFDIPAGRLMGDGAFAEFTVQSESASGGAAIPTAIEQFDLQNLDTMMWGFDTGWNEAEYSPTLGLWRWTSDRSTLRLVGPTRAVRLILPIEDPIRYFDRAPRVRVLAGEREVASTHVSETRVWAVDVPEDAVAASGGSITIETDETFVPAERGGPPDFRRLGLRIFGVRVGNPLTPGEANR